MQPRQVGVRGAAVDGLLAQEALVAEVQPPAIDLGLDAQPHLPACVRVSGRRGSGTIDTIPCEMTRSGHRHGGGNAA